MRTKVSRRQFVQLAGSAIAVVSGLGLAGCSDAGLSPTKADTKESYKIAIVCDSAGKNDGGYNQKAIEAAQKIATDQGWECKVVEPTNGVPKALEALGDDGYKLVFSMEYDFEALINGAGGAQPIAQQFPDTTWVIFNDNPNQKPDGSFIHSNVISILFNLNESSFIAGALSVLVNEHAATLFGSTNYKFSSADAGGRAMGFIGGTNSNGITVFSYGFIQGIQYEAEKLGVTYDYYAKYDAGFSDSAAGSTVAGTYYDRGANIVFGCAGNVGDGITAKAKEAGKLSIQVDANKDGQQPGYVLTSVLKSVDVPVNNVCDALQKDNLTSLGNLINFSLSTGATDITDLSTISSFITSEGSSIWNDITSELKTLREKIGSEIKIVNSQIGENFDASSCPNVNIK